MMSNYSKYNAENVLNEVEKFIKRGLRCRIEDCYEELSIFDWWNTYLSVSQAKQMRSFLKDAIKLGYTGYVCFRVGASGCSHGMWAAKEETTDGYSPNCATLFRSFTPAVTYWDVTDKHGNWNFEGRYAPFEDPNSDYANIKTIRHLESFIKKNSDKVYVKEGVLK